jgi:hypothetical protein
MNNSTNNDNDNDNNNNKKEKKKNDHINDEILGNNARNDGRTDSSSIFYILDGIIDQLNKTKKLFIIMILTVMIIPPIAFMLTFVFFGFPFHNNDDHSWFSNKPWGNAIDPNTISNPGPGSGPNFDTSFGFLPLIPVIVVLVWLGIGIRQWFVLSKWDKKYKKYKELQRKVNEELDKD